MELDHLREDASWNVGKNRTMPVKPAVVLALVDLAEASEKYISKPGEKTLKTVVLALKRVREV